MDFEQMGWHDNYIHLIVFPKENQKISFRYRLHF